MSDERAVYARIFARDLEVLAREIALYPDDAALWKEVPGQPTLGGSLALHLVGNLRHFIGRVVGGTDYVRDREAEFESRGRSRKELQALVQAAQAEVAAALAGLEAARLDAPFPEPIRGHQLDTRTVLVHLITHLSFHLGQLDYHRRAATGDRASAEPGGFAQLLAP
ncbi:MAG TPA: DinB family protein [Holophagaceae bacterium]|nr:DinB family protein [Holophagaceae bacterium]